MNNSCKLIEINDNHGTKHEHKWKSIKIFYYFQKSMKIYKNSPNSFKIYENQWKSKIIFLWKVQFEPSDFTNQNTLETRFKRHFLRFLPPQGLVPIFLGGIWKSPPRIFKKHQSQNWPSYYVSNLKFVKPLIKRENGIFVFLTTNHFFSSSRRVQGIWIGLIASTPSW